MNLMTYLCSRLITEKKKDKKDKNQISTDDGLYTLDNILQGTTTATSVVKQFTDEVIKPNGPVIYAFITPKVPDAIKIGYTDQAPEKRIDQWRKKYDDANNKLICIGYWSAMAVDEFNNPVFFWDHAVHGKVVKKGYTHLSTSDMFKKYLKEKNILTDVYVSHEFFEKYIRKIGKNQDNEKLEELSPELLEDILNEMKQNIKNGNPDFKIYKFDEKGNTTSKEAAKRYSDPDTYSNTQLQQNAIDNAHKAIEAGKKSLLMAAVMRFGKTHACYEIVKQEGFKRVLVVSAKADVRKSWRDDINHERFYKDFVFIEFDDKYDYIITQYDENDKCLKTDSKHISSFDNIVNHYADQGKTVVLFATLQDLTGSLTTIKKKHEKVFDKNTKYDIMIIDETHYGSHGEQYSKVDNLADDEDDVDESLKKEIEDEQEDVNKLKGLHINNEYTLQVSGTPYYILASNEFNENFSNESAIISKVSYTDMIKARDKWEEDNDEKPKDKREDPSKSPYFGIPTLHKIGLRLTKDCEKAMRGADMTDSMGVLFTTYTTEKPKKGKKFRNKQLTNDKQLNGKFVNESAIENLMKSIFGINKSNTLSFLGNKKVEGSKVCKHTMIVLPSIAACQAMKPLLESFINTDRKVICIVGKNPDVKNIQDLNHQLAEQERQGKYSVVLTVTKYLTGVSMPLLDSMLFMKNAKSPQDYDQAIFRLCTRCVKEVKEEDNNENNAPKKVNMKSNVYLIDFNFTTMFTMLANGAIMKANANGISDTETIKQYIKDEISATPIFNEKMNGQILDKIDEANVDDMMKYFCGYSENKSMSDIVDDGANEFKGLFNKKDMQEALIFMRQDFGKAGKGKKKLEDERERNGTLSFPSNGAGGGAQSLSSYAKNKLEDEDDEAKDIKSQAKITREQFKYFLRYLIYCNICLDKPYNDLGKMVDDANKNTEFKELLKDFKIHPDNLKEVYDVMPNEYRLKLNQFLTKFSIMSSNINDKDYSKIMGGIAELGGRFGRSEVVTPPALVDKMLDKVGHKTFEDAETILIINSKSCEFVSRIKERYTEKVAKKCRIVCSSVKTQHLIRKILNSMGMNVYINDMILPIEDRNHNNILYDDFLTLKNDKILNKWNMGKKFDVCLMNPPYDKTLHLKFLEKCIDINKLTICVHPIDRLVSPILIYKPYFMKAYKHYEPLLKHCHSVEKIDATEFGINVQGSLGITIWKEKTVDDWTPDKYSSLIYNEDEKNVIKKIMSKITSGNGENNLYYFVKHNVKNGDIIQYIPAVHGNVKQNGAKQKDYYDLFSVNYKKARAVKEPKNKEDKAILTFKTESECKNFIDSTFLQAHKLITSFWKTDCNTKLQFIPWLHDYTKPITNDTIMNFFNLTNDERKTFMNMKLNYDR